jgi:hypothetical protein
MLGMTILQNAAFTWVSRARNSSSLSYHGIASTGSNLMYILVLTNIVTHLDNWYVKSAYVIGAVIGSVSMHYISMKYFEKGKRKVGS